MSDQDDIQEDHVWAQESIAAYVVGGLDPAELDRLETHATDCAACRQAIDETRSLERKMAESFVAANPGPALEDRVIRRLPSVPQARIAFPMTRRNKLLLLAAVSLLLALIGAGGSELMSNRLLRLPGLAPAER